MFVAVKKLGSNKGFTLAEAAISTAILASLLSIFALFPNFKASLARVNHRQITLTIVKEISSQLEEQSSKDLENQISDIAPQAILKNATSSNQDLTVTVPAPGSSALTYQVANRRANTTYNVTISSEFIDATDSNNNGDIMEKIETTDGSDTGRVLITVSWAGYRGGSISSDSVIYNKVIF